MEDIRPTIEISVRKLVEFVLVSGDIDDRIRTIDTVKAMQEGTKAHQKIQKSEGPSYHAEVPFFYVKHYDDYDLKINGRADGVIIPNDDEKANVTIDEIKGVYLDLDLMDDAIEIHLAQAKCYAFFYSEQHEKCEMSIRMTYVNLDNEKKKYFHYNFSYKELDNFFQNILSLYKRWSDFLFEWQIKRNTSIQSLKFPYDFREGQKELISKIYYSISNKKLLFLQAPTGTGKTLATIFPSIKAIGNGLASKVFYLTAKNVTRNVAFKAFEILAEKGLLMKTVMITAKEKICLNTEVKCNPENCIYARGHFDRVNDAVYELLTKNDIINKELISEWSKEKTVCPYYLSLDLAKWCDNIVCDYNYVFDPNAALSTFFTEGIGRDFIFLIDEAHNLIDRGREMYSETFSKEEVLNVKREINTAAFGIISGLTKLNRAFLNIKKSFESIKESSYENNFYENNYYRPNTSEETDFASSMGLVCYAFDRIFEKKIPLENEDKILEFYFKVRFFNSLYEYADSHYLFYFSMEDGKNISAHIFCVDPSKNIQEKLDYSVASVFFSATLLPMEYHKKLLCLEKKPFALFANSTFDPDNKHIFIGDDVTSLYKKRSDSMFSMYAQYIIRIISVRHGNYMAFFPSYSFMKEVLNIFYALYEGDFEVLVQENGMKESDKEAFLNTFEEKKNVIAFTVTGGAFSEGIDLTGESLIGVIICGAALPKFSIRQKIIEEYFSNNSDDGFSYAYLYPGMNKVLQAAGRVIRTESDHGIIVLLDYRFTYSSYKSIFPPDWEGHIEKCEINNITEKIKAYWNSREIGTSS